MKVTARKMLMEPRYFAHAYAYPDEPPENEFNEVVGQGTQRTIVLESLDLLRAYRPELRFFNELLIEYRKRSTERKEVIVPDTMVLLSDQPPKTTIKYELTKKAIVPL